jgi:transcriptional regulator with PAS, ATPase and Fis domain
MSRLKDPAAIRRIAKKSLFEGLDQMCEGAIIVDREARIAWLSDKYAARLGLPSAAAGVGRVVEDVIPNSLMREVVRTGEPIMLDIMQFGDDSFVVMRVPVKDERGRVIGAAGFMLFDRLQQLQPLVSKFAQLETRLADVQKSLAEERRVRYTFSNFIGTSAPAMEVKRQARRAAQSDTTVLLLGETGTGKEVIAQAIHSASPRAHGPFVVVNAAAIPDAMLEAEFFGAAPAHEGKFVLANGGTLFLDEVGDMPLATQAKLLRALQEKEVEPLGSNRVTKVDVRVIAASSVDLRQMVSMGRFRSDLYYRLSVLPIEIPPLRGRTTDLEALCDHILEDIARRSGRPQRELTPTALAVLSSYAWPGNIRELHNVLEQVALNSDRPRLSAEDLSLALPRGNVSRSGERPALRLAAVVAEAERSAIRSALAAAEGKKILAAELLGISRATLYQKLSTLAHGRIED